MKRSEINSILLSGIYAIGIIHLMLLNIFVTSLTGTLIDTAKDIAIIGILAIIVNTTTWLYARRECLKLIDSTNGIMSYRLMLPNILILVGWLYAYNKYV